MADFAQGTKQGTLRRQHLSATLARHRRHGQIQQPALADGYRMSDGQGGKGTRQWVSDSIA